MHIGRFHVVEDLESPLETLIYGQNGSDVAASVAIVGRRPHLQSALRRRGQSPCVISHLPSQDSCLGTYT